MHTPEHFPVTPAVVAQLFRAAAAKRILRGKREAVLARLEGLAGDLFPRGDGFFAALFAGGRDDAPPPATLRDIGDAFWRASFPGTERRRLEGSFYTPVPVIDRILDLVWDDLFPGGPDSGSAWRNVCDPAMGCGFFLLRIVERLLADAPGRIKKIRQWAAGGLFGADVDAGAVFMGRAFLWLALSDGEGEFIPDPAHFPLGDSLLGRPFGATAAVDASLPGLDWQAAFPAVAAAGGFDVMVGNPPYEVLTNFARRPERKAFADAIRRTGCYRDSLAGQINLYRCFIERSLDLLQPGGALSMVVPLSLARDASALPLRRRMMENDAAGEWILFGERDNLFPGVTQSACVFRAVKGKGGAGILRITAGGDTCEVTAPELAEYTGGTLSIPMTGRDGMRLLAWLWQNCPGRLADAAEARVGEVDQTVYRDCMRDEDTGCLLARGAHLTAFRLDAEPAPGKARFLDLRRFLRMKGASAEACRERAGEWRIAQLGIRNMHTSPRLVAALAPPGVYLGNSLNVYTPRRGLPLEYVAGILNARLLDWLFRAGSGNNNINLHEMLRLPFPVEPSPESMAAVIDAYRACAENAGDPARLALSRKRLDAAAEACYGVPPDLLDGLMHY